eukprot:scaffold202291_cov38-Attheya_sp.AAC.1
MAAAVKEHMSIFGWNDGCGVHMISTADGTEIGSVTRQIKAVSKVISAPKVVKRYNDGMQGVDHHDQLRTLFSLATRHQFRKYYVTLIMALIDFALVNAHIHYHMAHPQLKRHKEHRAHFMQTLSEQLRNANWHALQTKHYQRSMPRSTNNPETDEDAKQSGHVCNLLGLISQPSETLDPVGQDLLCRNVSSLNCNPRLCTDLKNSSPKNRVIVKSVSMKDADINIQESVTATSIVYMHVAKFRMIFELPKIFVSPQARCDFITDNKWSVAEPTPTITSAIRKSPRVYNKLPTSPVPVVNQGGAAQSLTPDGRQHRSGVISTPPRTVKHSI